MPANQAEPGCPVAAYARAVVAGAVVAGRLVRLACRRHLGDLEHGHERGLKWDPKAARLAVRFFPRFLRLNGGEHEGKPFEPEPWQAFILGSLFGWQVWSEEHGCWVRRFRSGYIEVGKGNGKSPLVAGIGIKCQIADDEPRAEVYAAATKKDQAQVLFRDAVAMVDQSPILRKRLLKTGPPGREWNLFHPKSGSFFRPIASDEGQSGPRPHCGLLDELHEHKSALVIDMMRAGTKGRRQALIVEITNSGHDRTSVCWQHHQYSAQVLEGLLPNDAWFAYVCQLDACEVCRAAGKDTPTEGCPRCDDWLDEAVWPKANPNLGVSVTYKYLREQVKVAQDMPAMAATVKRLNFCLWTEAATHAIPMDKWDACKRVIDREALKGLVCFGALDIGATSDFTCFTLEFPHDDAERVEVPLNWADPDGEKVVHLRRGYTLLAWFWLPEHPRRRDPYLQAVIDGWKRAGLVRTTPGEVVDYDMVLADILQIVKDYPFREIAVDRGFQGSQMCVNLQKHYGDAVVAFPQGILSMNAPFREFIELVTLGRLHHEGDPVTRWMVSNCAAETRGGLIKPSKEHSKEKIDVVSAAVMGLGRAMLFVPDLGGGVEFS